MTDDVAIRVANTLNSLIREHDALAEKYHEKGDTSLYQFNFGASCALQKAKKEVWDLLWESGADRNGGRK